jgi:hypothetical protein
MSSIIVHDNVHTQLKANIFRGFGQKQKNTVSTPSLGVMAMNKLVGGDFF